ncbi:hypothetical protein ASALC70_02243 [Alcanivorax sp. ALC70]|nr:hypothetical protein ASALC70_02243 [Alcanivorax sp. ALC70]
MPAPQGRLGQRPDQRGAAQGRPPGRGHRLRRLCAGGGHLPAGLAVAPAPGGLAGAGRRAGPGQPDAAAVHPAREPPTAQPRTGPGGAGRGRPARRAGALEPLPDAAPAGDRAARLRHRRLLGAGRSGATAGGTPGGAARRPGAGRLRRPRRQDRPDSGSLPRGAGGGPGPGGRAPGAGARDPGAAGRERRTPGRRRRRAVGLVGRRALRRHPAGRALLGHRHPAPPAGREMAPAPGRPAAASGFTSAHAGCTMAASAARRPAGVRHLLGAARGERPPGGGVPGAHAGRRRPHRATARGAGGGGGLATAAREDGPDGFYLACLRKHEAPAPDEQKGDR